MNFRELQKLDAYYIKAGAVCPRPGLNRAIQHWK